MGLIVKPNTFATGGTIAAAEHNSNYDTAYTLINGNIENANIKANAGIVDTKLATISTYGKVSGAALYNLSGIAAAAGAIPYVNLPSLSSGCSVTCSGDVTIGNGATVLVAFDTEGYDIASEFSTTNSSFTAAAAGYYLVTCSLQFNDPADGTAYTLKFYINGTQNIEDGKYAAKTGANCISASHVFNLAATNTVAIYAYSQNATTIESTNSLLTITKLSRA